MCYGICIQEHTWYLKLPHTTGNVGSNGGMAVDYGGVPGCRGSCSAGAVQARQHLGGYIASRQCSRINPAGLDHGEMAHEVSNAASIHGRTFQSQLFSQKNFIHASTRHFGRILLQAKKETINGP